jgi:AcrR family transcriptional regulator
MNAQRYSAHSQRICQEGEDVSQQQESGQQESGRAAQRRRTRRAIVDAAAELVRGGAEPSVAEIAAAADVSRRTVYLYYPTLDQLILDATLATLNVDVDAALQAQTSADPHERLETLVREMFGSMQSSLPLGRKLIKLTVDAPPPASGEPRRGHRRVGWIEWAIEPCRAGMTREDYADLLSALTLVIGWEAFIALLDVRGLTVPRARAVTLQAAGAILDAALSTTRRPGR